MNMHSENYKPVLGYARAVLLPPSWDCFADRVEAFLISHPDFDLDDAIEALIWGNGEDDEDQ